MYIELKRLRGGRLSEQQRAWLDALGKQGYAVAVCKGWEDAAETILRYLEGEYKK